MYNIPKVFLSLCHTIPLKYFLKGFSLRKQVFYKYLRKILNCFKKKKKNKKKAHLAAVGFEPTPPRRLVP